jgi:alpha-glucosidase (family GH31 glycosyl hydrolase)
MGPEMNYVGEKSTDPLTFEIYPDAQDSARTSLYEDDGVSPAYRDGVERRTTVTYRRSEIDVSAPTGTYQPGPRNLVFAVHPTTGARKPLQFADDGQPHVIRIH